MGSDFRNRLRRVERTMPVRRPVSKPRIWIPDPDHADAVRPEMMTEAEARRGGRLFIPDRDNRYDDDGDDSDA
jgi:hypothetical protein